MATGLIQKKKKKEKKKEWDFKTKQIRKHPMKMVKNECVQGYI